MPPTHNTPSRRRSRHELRLEQIAIWGDAAAAHGRSSTSPHHPPSPDMNAQPIDLALLEAGLTALPEGMRQSGSLSMCHSRSAEEFRRSGKHGAVARASLRGSRSIPPPRREDGDRVVVTRRGVLSKSRDYKLEISAKDDWKTGLVRRHSEAKRERRARDDVPILMMKSRRESMEMRERDENDFRLSNAKLPERLDEPATMSFDWAKFRRRRTSSSTPILGRYTRSRSSQLPSLRPKSRRLHSNSKG